VTRRVIILGSTGSIGTQAIETIEHLNALAKREDDRAPAPFEVVGLAGGRNAQLLAEQARRLGVRHIAIKDESISDSHAKIQKRADGWYVVDQESTNGTYVGGRRVQGEVRVEGAPDLRFGGIKMTFRPVATTQDAGGGTRAIAAVNVDAIKKQAASAKSQAASQAAAKAMAQAPEEKKKGCAAVILLLVSLAGTGVGLLSLLLLAGR